MIDMEMRHHRELTEEARAALIEVYADVRAPLLHLPNYALPAFTERLDRHANEPGFEAVIGYDRGEPVGYAYGNTIRGGDRWWTRMNRPLPTEVTDLPTLALKEIGVRTPWRGTGVARRIHDELLSDRTERQVTLMVNPAAGNGKVLALYETWGYKAVNEVQPSPQAPPLVAMIRPRLQVSTKRSMRIGITGHRGLSESVERQVRRLLASVLDEQEGALTGVSCIADGPDSWFAELVLERGGALEVVIPADEYRESLPAVHHALYDRLLSRAAEVHHTGMVASDPAAHMAGSEVLVGLADLVLAVWDGLPARGYGGTADVVDYAQRCGVPVRILWPEGARR